jgi:glutaredoxin-like protein NrdH
MTGVRVFSLPHCPQCVATYRMLDKLGVAYAVVDLTVDAGAFEFVRGLGYQAAPVVVIEGGEHWAGFRPDKIKTLIGEVLPSVAVDSLGAGLSATKE